MIGRYAKLRAIARLLAGLVDERESDVEEPGPDATERLVYVVMSLKTTDRDLEKHLGRVLHRMRVIYGNGIRMYGPVAVSDTNDDLNSTDYEIKPYNFRSDVG